MELIHIALRVLMAIGALGCVLYTIEMWSGRVNAKTRWSNLTQYQWFVFSMSMCSFFGFFGMLIFRAVR